MADDRDLTSPELDIGPYEAIMARDGVQVSKSPWGVADEIGRLNWVTPGHVQATLAQIGTAKTFELSVDYFVGMPSWTASGDPAYQMWLTQTPHSRTLDGADGGNQEVCEKYCMSVDSILMNTHCGTHIDTLTHVGHYGCFWNGWNEEEHLGGRGWLRGGSESYPAIIARGVLLDIAALHDTNCLPNSYAVTPEDLRDAARKEGVEMRPGDVVLIRTGSITKWPSSDYLVDPPGLGLAGAHYLCEEAGAMCVASDTIALEVLPFREPDSFFPVHSYMFATAGAQIMEVVWMEELAAEHQYEVAFLGFPLRLRGSTGAPMRAVAIPLAG